MELSSLSIIIIITLFALSYMIYRNVSEPLTAPSYIRTTYMYIFFALLLIVLINEETLFPIKNNIKLLALYFLPIVLIFVLQFIPQENQFLKHLAWIAFISSLAILLQPAYNIAKAQNILNNVLITVSAMFIVMTYFAYSKPLEYFYTWFPYLYSGLLGIIVAQLVNFIFSDIGSSGFGIRHLLISIISIFIFNGLLLYDTQKILKDGSVLETLCSGRDHLTCANYPDKSLSIELDLINLFVGTTNIYGS